MAKFTPLAQRTLQVAKRYVGLQEATGRNDGEQIRFWQRWGANGKAWLDGQPWCACFATWCVHRAHNELRREGQVLQPLLTPKNASSSSLYRWYKRSGKLLAKPKTGCVGLVKGGPTGHSHTFLVHDVQGGEVVGVDGNYRNGVRWSRRPASDCDYGEIC